MIDRLSKVWALDMEHANVFDMQAARIVEAMGKQHDPVSSCTAEVRRKPVIECPAKPFKTGTKGRG